MIRLFLETKGVPALGEVCGQRGLQSDQAAIGVMRGEEIGPVAAHYVGHLLILLMSKKLFL